MNKMDDVIYVMTKANAKILNDLFGNVKAIIKNIPSKEANLIMNEMKHILKIFSKEFVVIDLKVSQMDTLETNKIFDAIKKNGQIILFLREG
jgi:hypothetical protein